MWWSKNVGFCFGFGWKFGELGVMIDVGKLIVRFICIKVDRGNMRDYI